MLLPCHLMSNDPTRESALKHIKAAASLIEADTSQPAVGDRLAKSQSKALAGIIAGMTILAIGLAVAFLTWVDAELSDGQVWMLVFSCVVYLVAFAYAVWRSGRINQAIRSDQIARRNVELLATYEATLSPAARHVVRLTLLPRIFTTTDGPQHLLAEPTWPGTHEMAGVIEQVLGQLEDAESWSERLDSGSGQKR